MEYTENYRDLCHGTTLECALKIYEEGFQTLDEKHDNWCGSGVYFYDIKAKSWWAANRKCKEIKKSTGSNVKPSIVFADIMNIKCKDIFDMRVEKKLMDFERAIEDIFSFQKKLAISGMDDSERIIKIRASLISFYAEKHGSKLVIGNFRQRPQPLYEHAIEFANSLDMIFGIETIYCVKDRNILSNIRIGGHQND